MGNILRHLFIYYYYYYYYNTLPSPKYFTNILQHNIT